MAECILKLKNCTVEKLNIKAVNNYKLMDAESCNILNSAFDMFFDSDGISQDFLTQDLITLDSSSLNISKINLKDIINLTPFVISSKNNSKSYTSRVYGAGDASPSWTDRFASSPTYGNGMAYNVYSGQFIEDTIIFGDNVICNPWEYWYGGDGFIGGAYNSNNIYRINIASETGTNLFGTLPIYISGAGACSNGSEGLFMADSGVNDEDIYKITFSIINVSSFFSNLTVSRNSIGAISDGILGVFTGGVVGAAAQNTIDYITFATQSDATDFGDLTIIMQGQGAYSDGTTGLTGGYTSWTQNALNFNTQANAIEWGDMYYLTYYTAGCSDRTTGLFGGGLGTKAIQKRIISINANGTYFGDLTVERSGLSACSDGTYGVWAGGVQGGTGEITDKVTIAIEANATDFADPIPIPLDWVTACSGN